MLKGPRPGLEVLSISALDLFASALGVFVLVAVLMFPYYLRSPSVEVDQAGATAAFEAAGAAMTDAEQQADEAEMRKAAAEQSVAEVRRRLAEAEAAATALAEEAGRLEAEQEQAARQRTGTPDPNRAAITIADLDLVLVLDATGSMRGALGDLRANLIGIVRILHRLAPTLRVGFVAYKDVGEPYLTRSFPLTSMSGDRARDLLGFVRALDAEGGGDVPEPVDRALEEAVQMGWRDEAQGRILVIGDAPVHTRNWQRSLDLARTFRASASREDRPRSVTTILTGRNPGAEPFFQALANAGGGEMIDHQGRMIESILISVLRKDET